MKKFKKYTVLGAGAFGTALGKVLTESGQNCLLWTIEPDVAKEINETCLNTKYCAINFLPKKLKATLDLEFAIKDTDVIILAVPTTGIKEITEKMLKIIEKNNSTKKFVFITIAKGFSPNNTVISEYLKEVIPESIVVEIVSLIGPSLAIEVLENQLTTVSIVTKNKMIADILHEAFNSRFFNTRIEDDLMSCEYASILKNIYAILSGMYRGLGFEFNTLGWLIPEILKEMHKIIEFKKGDPSVVYRLTGIGDLMVTATNKKSRNFSYGFSLGRSESQNSVHHDIQNKTVEGYNATKTMYNNLPNSFLKELPLLSTIYDILYKKADLSNKLINLFRNLR